MLFFGPVQDGAIAMWFQVFVSEITIQRASLLNSEDCLSIKGLLMYGFSLPGLSAVAVATKEKII